MNNFLTAKNAALQLGVSASTLKRFCENHGIKLSRTPGGHRRIDSCQLALVEKLLICKQVDLSASLPGTDHIVDLLIKADSIAI
jgi:excisionase family DNA binding protein